MREITFFSICTLLSLTACPTAKAADFYPEVSQTKVSKAGSSLLNSPSRFRSRSHICSDTKGGAWDWSNWQDVVSDCKIYVFRKRMISKR